MNRVFFFFPIQRVSKLSIDHASYLSSTCSAESYIESPGRSSNSTLLLYITFDIHEKVMFDIKPALSIDAVTLRLKINRF